MLSKRLLFALLAQLPLVAAPEAQTVHIAQGVIEGRTEGGTEAFRNVPFAAPPVGPLRWTPPRPAAGWSGTRDAGADGPACPQAPPPPVGAVALEIGDNGPLVTSEDCLNLAVRRPAGTKAGAKLPVMVWIYGGAFLFGRNSEAIYAGAPIVERGVILVVPNYRLGALGFLAHPALTAADPHHSSGNYAALDVIAALRWVKANIAAFGGDPANVTVFGESAGAVMVGMLAGSPLTQGLFRRGISESGVFFGPVEGPDDPPFRGATDTTLASAERQGVDYLKALGVASIAEARTVPPERLLAATQPGPGKRGFFYRPNVDGWVLPVPSYAALTRGAYDRPMIVGWNGDEGAGMVPPNTGLAQYRAQVGQQWGPAADTILAAYPASTDAQAVRALRDLQRDVTFVVPAWTWARGQRAAPVYLYSFDHRPPFPAEPPYEGMGTPHAGELPYVFGKLDAPAMRWGADDRAISRDVIGYWTNFARTGDPNGGALPRWAPVAASGERPVLRFGVSTAKAGAIDGLPRLEVLDRYFAPRRPGGQAGATAAAGRREASQ